MLPSDGLRTQSAHTADMCKIQTTVNTSTRIFTQTVLIICAQQLTYS